ncbi:hypothetical protein A6A26_24160 (plasmid) [Pantoea sp. OXWO6B1]|nr:hypothetical protein A6A26_24160 [Pantoea sp. OXWO6B1]
MSDFFEHENRSFPLQWLILIVFFHMLPIQPFMPMLRKLPLIPVPIYLFHSKQTHGQMNRIIILTLASVIQLHVS